MEAKTTQMLLAALLIILILGVAVVVTALAGAAGLGALAMGLRAIPHIFVGLRVAPTGSGQLGPSRERR